MIVRSGPTWARTRDHLIMSWTKRYSTYEVDVKYSSVLEENYPFLKIVMHFSMYLKADYGLPDYELDKISFS